MKKIIFLVSVLTFMLCTTTHAQTIDILQTTRVNTEGLILSKKLADKIINSKKEFMSRSQKKIGSHILLTVASFDHQSKVFTVQNKNDMNSNFSLLHESVIRVCVYPQGRPQDEVCFSDYLLNGSWDEHESCTAILAFNNVSHDEDEKIQEDFIETLREALQYLE